MGCEYLTIFIRSSAFDSYGGEVSCSPKVTQACLHIFKQTPEEMSLKIEAFCVAGLGGMPSIVLLSFDSRFTICCAAAISASSGLEKLNRVKAQRAIRDKISMGLH